MLIIRLRRIGKKHHPTFRFVISEKAKDTKGDFLEDLGHYDPHPSPSVIEFKEERVKYWLAQGVQASDTVYNLLVEKGLIQGDKRKAWKPKKKKKKEGEEESKPADQPKEAVKEDKTKEKTSEAKPEPVKEEKPVEEKSKEEVKTKEEKPTEEKKEKIKPEDKEAKKPEEKIAKPQDNKEE